MTRGSQKLRTALLLSCGLLCIGAVFLTRTASRPARAQTRLGQVVNSITAEAQVLTVPVSRMPSRPAQQKTPPDQPPRKTPKRPEDVIRLDPPIDPSVRPEDIRPMNAPTEAKITAQPPGEKQEGKKNVPQAPGTFTLFRNTGLASAPVVGGVALNSFIPIEPSAATNGRVVFYTTNSYAAISGDGGQTFSYLNPFDFFPADGTNDPINGGFGGDQYVYYERTRGLLCWLIQYNPDNTTNRYRLVLARSQADALNNNWYFYDFTPATFGLVTPAGAQGRLDGFSRPRGERQFPLFHRQLFSAPHDDDRLRDRLSRRDLSKRLHHGLYRLQFARFNHRAAATDPIGAGRQSGRQFFQ